MDQHISSVGGMVAYYGHVDLDLANTEGLRMGLLYDLIQGELIATAQGQHFCPELPRAYYSPGKSFFVKWNELATPARRLMLVLS